MSSITTAVSDGRMDIGGPRLIALTCLLLLVFSAAVAMSFNISGFVTSFNISFTEAGTIATLELGGIAVSSLVFSQLAPRLQPRPGNPGVPCWAVWRPVWAWPGWQARWVWGRNLASY